MRDIAILLLTLFVPYLRKAQSLAAILGSAIMGKEAPVERKTGDLFGLRQGNWKRLPTGDKEGDGKSTLCILADKFAAKQPDRVASMMAEFEKIVGKVPTAGGLKDETDDDAKDPKNR